MNKNMKIAIKMILLLGLTTVTLNLVNSFRTQVEIETSLLQMQNTDISLYTSQLPHYIAYAAWLMIIVMWTLCFKEEIKNFKVKIKENF